MFDPIPIGIFIPIGIPIGIPIPIPIGKFFPSASR